MTYKKRKVKNKQIVIKAKDFKKSLTHKEIENQIYQFLELNNIVYSWTDASRSYGKDGNPRKSKVKKGWPDITVCLPPFGQMLGIEVKAKNDELSDEQELTRDRIIKSGGFFLEARSLDDVINFIKTYKSTRNRLSDG